MYIDSIQNPRVKSWAQLKTKRGRQQQGLFIVEGLRLAEEAFRSSVSLEAVLWDVGTDELPTTLLERAQQRGVPVIELSPQAFAQVSDTTTPQGVIAIAKIPSVQPDTATVSHALVLDGIQDPGNVGTLIRTADAFDVGEVCCGTGTVDPYSPKVVRSTMGGLFRVPIRTDQSVSYIQAWREHWPDGQVALTSANARYNCYDCDLRRPTLLLVGSEAFGVSADAAACATVEVKIPMSGMAESLNAAIAGAILVYESFRQRQSFGKS